MSKCYRSGGCGPYEMYSCSECPASKPEYLDDREIAYHKWNTLSNWPEKTKVYISGKIAGDDGYRAKFFKAMSFFAEKGFIVLNPAVLPEGMTAAEYMSINFPMIFAADLVVFLPDHGESKGAQLELALCQYIDKPRIYLAGNADWLNWKKKREWDRHRKLVVAVNAVRKGRLEGKDDC